MLTVFAPGRTELAGNHTDHQKGRVLASAVSMGLTARVEKNSSNKVSVKSAGYDAFTVNLDSLSAKAEYFGTSKALLTGMLSSFKDLGLEIGGFDAEITSTLPSGSGLSSSAAFTVLMGRILNDLYNGGTIDPVVIARAAQKSENIFYGKPCGLMDQIACSVGHCVYVDFSKDEIIPITSDFKSMGLTLCLVNTGGSHADLSSSYARIPADMNYIANLFDCAVLSEVNPDDFYSKGWSKEDRPVRRAMHFFGENERVVKMRDALLNKDGEEYMRLMNESGRSSEELLNNIITSATGDTKLAEGLELSKRLLDGEGAWRVHGGGFAGCVQALMPSDMFNYYKFEMESQFGKNSCYEIKTL